MGGLATVENATVLLIAATVANGVATGATFDQVVKQLPARRRIGAGAYTAYLRAADLRNGLVWYPILVVSTAVTTVAAVVTGLLHEPTSREMAALIIMAAGVTAHVVATAPTALLMLTLRHGTRAVSETLDRYAGIVATHAAALATTLTATVCALSFAINL